MIITKTTTVNHVVSGIIPNIFKYDENFIDIRKKHKYKENSCFCCKRDFVLGEDLSLLLCNRGNKLVCCECAENVREVLNKEKNND